MAPTGRTTPRWSRRCGGVAALHALLVPLPRRRPPRRTPRRHHHTAGGGSAEAPRGGGCRCRGLRALASRPLVPVGPHGDAVVPRAAADGRRSAGPRGFRRRTGLRGAPRGRGPLRACGSRTRNPGRPLGVGPDRPALVVDRHRRGLRHHAPRRRRQPRHSDGLSGEVRGVLLRAGGVGSRGGTGPPAASGDCPGPRAPRRPVVDLGRT